MDPAGIVTDATVYEAVHVNRKTADAYERLLTNVFVLDVVPAWLTNRLSRLIKTPKRYLTDPALIGAALRVDAHGVMRDRELLGRVLDTFDAAHLEWLRDRLGDQFLVGVILQTGPSAFSLSDRIATAPIASLWT